jgi:hypothetical protein
MGRAGSRSRPMTTDAGHGFELGKMAQKLLLSIAATEGVIDLPAMAILARMANVLKR